MESVIAALLRHVPAARYDSRAWCLEALDALGCELAAEGRAIETVGRRRRRDVSLFLRLAWRLRAQRIDVLHCHDELSWFYGAVAARLSGRRVPVVMTLHGRRPGISARHRLEQRALAAATSSLVSVSDYLRRQVASELCLPQEAIATVVNGIDLRVGSPGADERLEARARLGLPDDALVVGSVGELSAVKNIDLMLAAAAMARQWLPSLRVLLVGDGAHRARLEERASAVGLRDTVFAGVRRDVPALLPAFDIYICSSDYEGISLAILEAMARGRAVIATAVGGNPELIRDEFTGVLVPKGDEARLAEAIVRLGGDPAWRERLGRAAQERVCAHHGIARMVNAYVDLYDAVIAGSTRLGAAARRSARASTMRPAA